MIIFSIAAAILLVIGTLDMPNWYYDIMKIAVCIYCAGAASFIYEDGGGKKATFIIYIALAILFIPFVPYPFEKTAWIVIDIVTAIFILVTGYVYYKKQGGTS